MGVAVFIFNRLTEDATVSGLVGTKVYPDKAPQDQVAPYVIYQTLFVDPKDTKDGASELDFENVQIDCYSTSRDEAETLAEAVRTSIDRFSGTQTGQAITSVRFLTKQTIHIWEMEMFLISHDYQIMLPR